MAVDRFALKEGHMANERSPCVARGLTDQVPDVTAASFWLAGFATAHRRTEQERLEFITKRLCSAHALEVNLAMAMVALRDEPDGADASGDGQ